MAIYSSILPAKFHRQRSLVGYTQCGLKVGHGPRMTPPLTRSLYFAMQALFPSSHLAFIIRIYIKISHKILCCLFHAHLYFFLLNYYNRSKVRFLSLPRVEPLFTHCLLTKHWMRIDTVSVFPYYVHAPNSE